MSISVLKIQDPKDSSKVLIYYQKVIEEEGVMQQHCEGILQPPTKKPLKYTFLKHSIFKATQPVNLKCSGV